VFLIDTDICIYTIKQKPTSIISKIKQLEPHQIKISAVTVFELEYGVAKSLHHQKNKFALLKFLSAFDILPFNDKDAEICGYTRAFLEKIGQIIGPYDIQIAAQAINRDLTLVSNNSKEFLRIPGLKYENWVQ